MMKFESMSQDELRAQASQTLLGCLKDHATEGDESTIANLELLLHQKASVSSSEQPQKYNRLYIDSLREIITLITSFEMDVTQVFEKMYSGNFGWNNPVFAGYVEQEKKNIMNLFRPIEVEEGIYTCPSCKGKKTHHFSRQMRSSDEPATTFITCANKECQYKWKIN
jgi:DNA-directed RNA polymerase subunit M/transcription elongation factor TFIIS